MVTTAEPTPGRRHEDLRGNGERQRGPGVDLCDHRWDSVVLVPRNRHQPPGYLELDHYDKTTDLGNMPERIQHQRRPDVVREVGNHHPSIAIELRRQIHLGGVDESQVDVGHTIDDLTQKRFEVAVDLIGDHLGPGRCEGHGQGSGSGSDLHDPIAGANPCHLHDLGCEVRVGQKVLAECLPGRQIMTFQELSDVRPRLSVHASPGGRPNTSTALREVSAMTSGGSSPHTSARADPTSATHSGSF